MLELCAAGQVKCSGKTSWPPVRAATIRAITAHLAHGDFYPDPIAAFAWPLLIQAGGLTKLDGTHLQLTRKGRTDQRERALLCVACTRAGDQLVISWHDRPSPFLQAK